uniref:Uncharacterized protein n=1 Tax=Molossus molossus TaxID=27622 RepID=A0A7J8ERV8_MOLMO|nr:hypothetical protein HJG59_008741 [Molossus molossus]
MYRRQGSRFGGGLGTMREMVSVFWGRGNGGGTQQTPLYHASACSWKINGSLPGTEDSKDAPGEGESPCRGRRRERAGHVTNGERSSGCRAGGEQAAGEASGGQAGRRQRRTLGRGVIMSCETSSKSLPFSEPLGSSVIWKGDKAGPP